MRTSVSISIAIGIAAMFGDTSATFAGWTDYNAGTPLSKLGIHSVAGDSSGTLWFGTSDGLLSFNGSAWTGLDDHARENVWDILFDRSGSMWLGTSAYVARSRAGSWQYFNGLDGLARPPFANEVNAHDLMEADNGDIWVATSSGVDRYDGSHWHGYTLTQVSMANDFPDRVLQDGRGHIWTVGLQSASEFDGTTWHGYAPFGAIDPGSFYSATADSVGIWIASSDGGIAHYDGSTWVVDDLAHGFPTFGATALVIDRTGILWAGLENGTIGRHDAKGWQYYPIPGTSSTILGFAIDSTGTLWASVPDGAIRYDGSQWTALGQHISQSNNRFGEFFCDPWGALWVVTDGGITRFTGEDWISFPADAPGPAWSLFEDHTGGIWIGRFGVSIDRFDGSRWTSYNKSNGLADPRVNGFVESGSGELLAATESGLLRFDGTSWSVHPEDATLAGRYVKVPYRDSRDRIWVGIDLGQVGVFDHGAWKIYSETDGLPNSTIFDLTADGNDSIWARTYGGGVSRFEGDHWHTFAIASGLPDDYVNRLAVDPRGDMWLATGSGLARFNGTSWTTVGSDYGQAHVRLGVYDFAFVDSTTMLLAIYEGIIALSPTHSYPSYRMAGAPQNVIGFFKDSSNGVWARTFNGDLFRYQGTSWEPYSTEGLLGRSGVQRIYETRRSDMWFGTQDGVAIRYIPDHLAPRLSLITCPPSLSASPVPTIAWLPGFRDDSARDFQYQFDDEVPSPWGYAVAWPSRPVSDGTHEIKVIGRDRYGNVQKVPTTCRFGIDATAPDPQIASPSARTVVRQAVEVRGRVDDLRFANYRVTARRIPAGDELRPPESILASSDTAVANGGVLARLDPDSLPHGARDDGLYDIQLSVRDTLGLEGTTKTQIIIDRFPPAADVTSPVPISSRFGGEVFSEHGDAHLYLPPNALSADGVVEVDFHAAGGVPDMPPGPFGSALPALRITLGGSKLNSPAVLDVALDSIATDRPACWLFADTKWKLLSGTFDTASRRITTLLDREGFVAVASAIQDSVAAGRSDRMVVTPRVFSVAGAAAPRTTGYNLSDRVAITFYLDSPKSVDVSIYNRAGRLVRKVASDRQLESGLNTLSWDGTDFDGKSVAAGLFIVAVEGPGIHQQTTVAVVP